MTRSRNRQASIAPIAELRAATDAVLAANNLTEARLRITVTGGPAPPGSRRARVPPTVVVVAFELEPTSEAAAVMIVPWTRNERGALAGLKTISYAENVRALAHVEAHGAHEAIFANTQGRLCEATGSNVFLVLDGQCCTPPLSAGWYNRRKSHHFELYTGVANEFGALAGIDPWLVDPCFAVCGKIDFRERTGEECLASNVASLLARIARKYAEYGIDEYEQEVHHS